jgi:hypothetical protein
MRGGSARWLRPLAMPAACCGASLALVVTVTLLLRGAEMPLFVAHLVVAVLAAGAAYLIDDPAVEATAVVPRPLLRRRLRTVLPGLGVICVAAVLVAEVLQWRSPSIPLGLLAWETAGLVGLSLAAAAIVFGSDPEPGNLVAALLALLVLGTLIGQSMLPVDLLETGSGDAVGANWWAMLAGASAMVLVWTSLGPRVRSSARTTSGPATPSA